MRAMFFGIERGRGRHAAHDVYTKYMPSADHAAQYGGWIRFICGGRCFHLERFFIRGILPDRLYCMDDGEEMSLPDGDLHILLGSISEKTFLKTAYAGPAPVDSKEALLFLIAREAENTSTRGRVDIQKIEDDLRKQKKRIEQDIRRLHDTGSYRVSQLKSRITYVQSEIGQLEEQLSRIRREVSAIDRKRSEVQDGDVCDMPGQKEHMSWLRRIIQLIRKIFTHLFRGMRDRECAYDDKPYAAADECAAVRRCPFDEAEQEKRLRLHHDILSEKLDEKRKQIEKWKQDEQRLYETELLVPMKRLERKRRAVEDAAEGVRETADILSARIRNRYMARVSEIFSYMAGCDRRIDMDENDIYIHQCDHDNVKRLRAEQLSTGALTSLWAAMRLAGTDLIYEEPMPLFFDESFAFLDTDRLRRTIRFLHREKEQTFIFSCHDREGDILREILDKEDQCGDVRRGSTVRI